MSLVVRFGQQLCGMNGQSTQIRIKINFFWGGGGGGVDVAAFRIFQTEKKRKNRKIIITVIIMNTKKGEKKIMGMMNFILIRHISQINVLNLVCDIVIAYNKS